MYDTYLLYFTYVSFHTDTIPKNKTISNYFCKLNRNQN